MNQHRFAATAILGALAFGLLWYATTPPVASFQEVVEAYQSSDAALLDRNGDLIQELRADHQGRRLEWVPLEHVSPQLLDLVVFSEDRDFYQHGGVDWGAVAAAAWATLTSQRQRGASTLSMQLAGLMNPSLQPRSLHRTLLQKWGQVRGAFALEAGWTKQQILEAYLNLVSFRGELQGIAAASRGLFGKAPHGLDSTETAILVSLLRSPNAASEEVVRRASGLAQARGLHLEPGRVADLVGQALMRPYRIAPRAGLAPHLARRFIPVGPVGDSLDQGEPRGRGPTVWRSTLDAGLQRLALEGLQEQLRRLGPQNVNDGAVLVVDNASGEVLAYVGNGGDFSSARYVDGVQARRQAGSTLKPFLYGLALERRLITPASPLNDAPLELAVTGGVYRPSNYDNTFHGLVSARVALASSLNIPAVRLLELVGLENFVACLDELGFGELQGADYYGPALALGTADISLWELVNAYRTLANHGRWTPLQVEQRVSEARRNGEFGTSVPRGEVPSPRRVYSESAAFLVSDILSDRESRSLTFGLENVLATSFWSAVKTGTSKDMRDNWCVGYSARFTVGVWMGNFSGEPMWNVSGISGAAPLWLGIMNQLHGNLSSPAPLPPPGVVAGRLEGATEIRPEWFQEGTEETRPRAVPGNAVARILYPAHLSVLALDPDIPDANQRVFFEASSAQGMRWRLNGSDWGPAVLTGWQPVSGLHQLELIDRNGRHLDGVAFSVRGAASLEEIEPEP